MAVRVKDRIEGNIRQSDKWTTLRAISISETAGTTGTNIDGTENKTLVIPQSISNFLSISSEKFYAAKGLYYGRQNSLPILIPSANDFYFYYVDSSNTSDNDVFRKTAIKYLCTNNPGVNGLILGRYWPNSHGILIGDIYSTSTVDATTGLPQYSTFWASNLSGEIKIFGTSSYNYYERTVLDSSNYTSYTITKTGSGASGTWGINITGNAAKLGTSTVGNSTSPIYLSSGTATACSGRTVPGIKSASAVSDLGWGTNNNYVPDIALLAYWNGRYSSSSSNLTYCVRGAFGTIVTKSDSDYLRYYDTATDLSSLNVVNTPSYLHTVSVGGSAPTTATKPSGIDNAWGVLHMHLHSGNYAMQLGFGGTTGKLYYRNAYNSTSFTNWAELLTGNGGEITGRITKKGSSASWINGRDQALIAITTYSAYNAGLSMKTTNGSWEIGVYTSDNLWFTYASDANYNAGTNTVAQFKASSAGVLYGAAWNDYAEFRITATAKAGEVVVENGNGTMHRSYKRLEPAANVVSDTYGFAIGETERCGTPIAVAGRVLVYPYEDRYSYKAGDAVCSAPDGKVSKMTREEMVMYPDCIIGYISEIPEYEVWGQTDVPVNGRIWIKV